MSKYNLKYTIKEKSFMAAVVKPIVNNQIDYGLDIEDLYLNNKMSLDSERKLWTLNRGLWQNENLVFVTVTNVN